MLEQQLSGSRNRQRSEPPQSNETSLPTSKRQTLSHPSASQPPAIFWDNLSNIWLTKRALRELDQRNTRAAPNTPHSPYRQVRRPVTRNFLAESKTNRQPNQDTADYISCCNTSTLKDVKLFTRHGGLDLSDLRNYPEPIPPDHTMNSSQSSSQSQQRSLVNPPSTESTTTKTQSTAVYDGNFEQHLIDHGVYSDEYEYPDGSVPAEPNNWEDINQMLARRRPSLSPSRFSNKDFKEFKRANAHAYARTKREVSAFVLPIIEGKIAHFGCRLGGIPFTNLDPLTDGTLKPGNPDTYYGARPEQLARKVRDDLGGQITPSPHLELPMAPNFFLAVKGQEESLAAAGRQACYDGALGARGMHSLQSYGREEPVSDNNAYTITSIYHGGTLKMYTSNYVQRSQPEGRPECFMNQLNAWSMSGNLETFRQGATAYRNAKDWTKEQRDKAIQQANDRANPFESEATAGDASGAGPASSFVTAVSDTEAYTMSQESRTSMNEGDFQESDGLIQDSAEHRVPAKYSRRQQPHRKRRNTDVSGAEETDGSTVVPGGLGRKRRGRIAGCADSIQQASFMMGSISRG